MSDSGWIAVNSSKKMLEAWVEINVGGVNGWTYTVACTAKFHFCCFWWIECIVLSVTY